MMQMMVRNEKGRAEGGVRSCLASIGEWAKESEYGNEYGKSVCVYLYVNSNMMAHQGTVNLPLFLGVTVLMLSWMRGARRGREEKGREGWKVV